MHATAALQSRDLTVAGILDMCQTGVPPNTRVETAIAAHRIAFDNYVKLASEESHTLALHTLRAVILIRTPAAADLHAQIDYMSSLPISAWVFPQVDQTPERIRENTLAASTRMLAGLEDC